MEKSLRGKLGQNTAEYLLMLSIVVVGSVGLLTMFGKTIRTQFAAVTAGMTGDTKSYDDSRKNSENLSKKATERSNGAFEAKGIDVKEFSSEQK